MVLLHFCAGSNRVSTAVTTAERNSLPRIREFLGHKRLAFVGVSRNPQEFSRHLMAEFVRRGYDVVPVNPSTAEIDGLACFPRVQDVPTPVSAALLLTAASETLQVVQDCLAAGVMDVWMYRAGGTGAVDPEAVAFCQQHGMRAVVGECPFMFLPETAFFHRLHGFVRRILGSYPQAS